MDAHVDLESHCTHMSEGLFSHDAAYICLRMISDDGAGLLRDQIALICRFFLVSVGDDCSVIPPPQRNLTEQSCFLWYFVISDTWF